MSMAEGIGWGATHRPSPTVTGGGTATGGAEFFGHRDREQLLLEMAAGRWEPKPGKPAEFRPSNHDAARLQGFPGGYPFHGRRTAVAQQIGNAVPPLLAAHCVAAATGARIPANLFDAIQLT
jgi:DNA (cytosine-5)-methyltransferase 1